MFHSANRPKLFLATSSTSCCSIFQGCCFVMLHGGLTLILFPVTSPDIFPHLPVRGLLRWLSRHPACGPDGLGRSGLPSNGKWPLPSTVKPGRQPRCLTQCLARSECSKVGPWKEAMGSRTLTCWLFVTLDSREADSEKGTYSFTTGRPLSFLFSWHDCFNLVINTPFSVLLFLKLHFTKTL